MSWPISITQVFHINLRHSLRIAIPKPASVVPLLSFSQFRHPPGSSRRLHASPTRTFRGWSYLAKHQDEEKPPLPYQVGATIPARTWEPPFEKLTGGHLWAQGQLKEELQSEHPLETCLRYSGATDAPPEGERVDLHVVDEIRVRDLYHSQIAKVKVHDHRSAGEKLRSPLPSDVAITAKLYDPLYQDIEDEHPDIFRNTYNAFHRETCIYQQLKPLWGTVIPRFYGSLRAEVPVPGRKGQSRYVYAILYEYAPGIELSYIEVDEWSQAERMEIMKAIIDGGSWIRQAGIDQRDLLPRNLVLQGRPGHPLSVKMIDFDYAFFEFVTDPDDALEPEPPSSIVDRWTDNRLDPKEAFSELID